MIKMLWPVLVVNPSYMKGRQIILLYKHRYEFNGSVDEMMTEDILDRYMLDVTRKINIFDVDASGPKCDMQKETQKKLHIPLHSEIYTKSGMEEVLQDRYIDVDEVKEAYIFETKTLAKKLIKDELMDLL